MDAVQDGRCKAGLPSFGRPACDLCADFWPAEPASKPSVNSACQRVGPPDRQTLPERLTNKQSKGEVRAAFFKRRMDELDLEALDITWALTLVGGSGVLPALIEAWLLQAHLHTDGRRPLETRAPDLTASARPRRVAFWCRILSQREVVVTQEGGSVQLVPTRACAVLEPHPPGLRAIRRSQKGTVSGFPARTTVRARRSPGAL